jgi:pimeloyl-ACP methyl ester carboxylesterase
MEPLETHYTHSGDVNIAYQAIGDGPLDLVWISALTQHVELTWEIPAQARFFKRLSSLGRLILFDKRGTGMSDRVAGVPTLENRMDDIRAVMDAADSERAVLIGVWEGGALGSCSQRRTLSGRLVSCCGARRRASSGTPNFLGCGPARKMSVRVTS